MLSSLTLPLWLPFSSAFELTTLRAVAIQAAYHGIVVAVLSIFLYLEAVRRLGAFMASLFLSLIPPLTAALGAVWLSETPNLPELLGLLTVVAGMLLAFWAETRTPGDSTQDAPKAPGTTPSIEPEARINGTREEGEEE
jgi:drug/metabolite transporter (DMT)-like permease